MILVVQLGVLAGRQLGAPPGAPEEEMVTKNVHYIGELLYTDYLFPFEVVSVILLVALIGVIVLVKRDRPAQK